MQMIHLEIFRNLLINFKSFIYSFEIFQQMNMLKPYKIDDKDQEKASLLHHAGTEIFEIFTTLPGNDSADFDAPLVLLD